MYAAALALQHAPFGEIANDLLHEERVTRRPFGDLVGEPTHRLIGAEQLVYQTGGLRNVQRAQRDCLRTCEMSECAAEFGPIRDEHHRSRARNDGCEVGEHRLTGVVDPVHVFHDVERRLFARHRCGVEQAGQSSAARIRFDGGQRRVLVGDAQQVVQQHEVVRVRG